MKKIVILVVIGLFLTDCVATKSKSSGIDVIEFGSGGGVTGRYKTFTVDLKKKAVLNPDGSIKRSLEKQEISSLTKKLKETDFSTTDFNHPHNMSYFMDFKGAFTNKIVWGDPGYPAPEKVKELYSLLVELVK